MDTLVSGYIRVPLGTEVRLGPGYVVLDADTAPLPKEEQLPIFGPCLLWANGWINQDATWYGGSSWNRYCNHTAQTPRDKGRASLNTCGDSDVVCS